MSLSFSNLSPHFWIRERIFCLIYRKTSKLSDIGNYENGYRLGKVLVVQEADHHVHELLGADLHVKGVAAVHHCQVKELETESDDYGLFGLKSPLQTSRSFLSPIIRVSKRSKIWFCLDNSNLHVSFGVDFCDDCLHQIRVRSLQTGAGGVVYQLRYLGCLVHLFGQR